MENKIEDDFNREDLFNKKIIVEDLRKVQKNTSQIKIKNIMDYLEIHRKK